MQSATQEAIDAWSSDAIHSTIKVVASIGDNRFNENEVIKASSTKIVNRGINDGFLPPTFPFWSPNDAFNAKRRNSMRFAVADHGAKCDSSYRCLYVDYTNIEVPVYQRGWWSANKTDGNGNFINSPADPIPGARPSCEWIQDTFSPRNMNQIDLWLDDAYPNMKFIEVFYLNSAGTWVSLGPFDTDPNTYYYTWQIPLQEVQGLILNIYSTWEPYDFARLIQLDGMLVDDISEDVVSCSLKQDREEYMNTVPVGSTKANTINIVLSNVDQKYSPENSASPYYPYMTGNTELDIWWGVDTNKGIAPTNYEYVKSGHFYIDTWNADSSSQTTTGDGRDFSKFCQDNKVLSFGKIWTNCTVGRVFKDIMARLGKAPSQIFIDPYTLTTFDALFLKDKIIWQFMGEIAFADQGLFGFDENDNFTYQSYNAVYTTDTSGPTSSTPLNENVWNFSDATNIISASEETELYINTVTCNVYDYATNDATVQRLWSDSSINSLAWATLQSDIPTTLGGQPATPTSNPNDRINVNENLDAIVSPGSPGVEFAWAGGPPVQVGGTDPSSSYNSGGYLYIDDEIIQYTARDSNGFYQLTRGFLDTPVQYHSAGAYIGEVKIWNPLTFTNAPAMTVERVHCTAIDDIAAITDNQFGPLAKVLIWRPDAFGAVLAVGNTGQHWVLLNGSPTYNPPYSNGSINWSIDIAGKAVIPKSSKQLVGGPPIGRATYTGLYSRFIKRYGKNETVIDNLWVQSIDRANYLVGLYLSEYKNPRALINITCIPFPYLQLTDLVTITSSPSLGISNKQYNIVGIDYNYDGSLQATVLARETLASASQGLT